MLSILDTTLRDGSYVVDFQFTFKDTETIASELDKQNIHFIEVGHGLGLGASENSRFKAAASDREYLEAAAMTVKNARWGMFFIPGVGRMEDIDLAAEYGMDFIRIGTNVTETEMSGPYIERAKHHGMYVFSNFMKTYAVPPGEAGKYAARVHSFGADVVCVVDSAGGMLPENVESYFRAIRENTPVELGFHGHNNLGLAIANTLKAIDEGATVVDVSLRGLGRAAGNAVAEMLLFALKRKNVELGIDPLRLMNIAEEIIDPILKNYSQVDSLSIVSGYAQFHSSFMGTIMTYAQQYGIDPRELIIHVCLEDRVNPAEGLVKKISENLAQNRKSSPGRIVISSLYEKKEPFPYHLSEKAQSIAKEARTVARKYGHTPVFNIVQSYRNQAKSFISSVIYDGPQYTVATAEVSSPEEAKDIALAVDGTVEIILLDSDIKSPGSDSIIREVYANSGSTAVLSYSDIDCWGKSIISLIKEKLGSKIHDSNILIIGNNLLSEICALHLKLYGVKVVTEAGQPRKTNNKFNVLIYCEQSACTSHIEELTPDGFVIDALIGSLLPEVVNFIHEKNVPAYRPDMRIAIQSEIALNAGMCSFVSEIQGRRIFNGVEIAAGGVLAPRNTVIVDSIRLPKKVLGAADGRGFLIPPSDIGKEIQQTLKYIEENLKLL